MVVHHTGLVVRDLAKNIEIYKKLGYSCVGQTITDFIQNNKVVFLTNEDRTHMLELIAPLNSKSTVLNSIHCRHPKILVRNFYSEFFLQGHNALNKSNGLFNALELGVGGVIPADFYIDLHGLSSQRSSSEISIPNSSSKATMHLIKAMESSPTVIRSVSALIG